MFNTNTPNNPNKKDGMHPEDMRNMLIFFVIAAVLYFAYSHYILQPQTAALKAAQQAQQNNAAQIAQPAAQAQKPLPRAEALTQDPTIRRIAIDNGAIFGTISTKGARIDDIALHNYFETLDKKTNVAVLSPDRTEFPRRIEYGWVSSDKAIKMPDENSVWQISGNDKLTPQTPVTLTWDNGQGLVFEQNLAIDDDYLLTVTQGVTNNSGAPVTLHPYGLVSQRGIPPYFAGTWISHEGPIGFIGDELHQHGYKAMRKDKNYTATAGQGWTGITDKYWLAALIPPQEQEVKYGYSYKGPQKDPDNTGRYQTDFLAGAVTLAPGEGTQVESYAFVGAKQVLKLEAYQKQLFVPNFDLAVDFGWLWFMSKPFFYILHYAGQLIGNFGVAIIILTITIRGAVFPLTNLSYRSFAKMKKVAPQIVELRKSYGDDKQKLQGELVKLYQKEGVNPMSGCFPIILQIPIFFALYKVLFVTIEMRHAPFFGWIQDLSAPDPTSFANLFGLLPYTPPTIFHVGVWPCLMLLAMIIQKKLNPPPQDQLQRDMANYMPFLFAFMMSRFAAGLVIYWTFSALIGVIQQIIIMKSLNVPVHLFGETPDEKELEDQVEKGPAVYPLADMAEGEVEDALFGDHEDAPTKPVTPPKPKKSKKKK
ncbi:MAG: membrane protein insertase YidC [Bdellovibrionales bacterium]